MSVLLEVSYGGGHDNKDGEEWIRFVADQSQLQQYIKCSLLIHQQCFLWCKWNGVSQQIGVMTYNGMALTPDGEAKIGFRGDVNSVDATLLQDLKQAVAGKKTFQLLIITSEEAQALQGEVAGQPAEEEGEEELVTTE